MAKEAEALFRIHGVDQRSSELTFTHPALADGAPIRLRQDGSDSDAAFVPGTSTVIWPCAYTLGDFLCDATCAWRSKPDAASADPFDAARGARHPDTVVVELGAGLGLAGLVAAGLGAKRVAITDATPLAARRNLEAAGFENASVHELWWRRAACATKRASRAPDGNSPDEGMSSPSPTSDEEAPEVPTAEGGDGTLTRHPSRRPRAASHPRQRRVLQPGKAEMQMLVDTMAALAEPGRTTISRCVRG